VAVARSDGGVGQSDAHDVSMTEHPLLPPKVQREYRSNGFWEDKTIAELVALQASERPLRIAIRGKEEFTYGEIDHVSRKIASALHDLGLRSGDFLAIVHEPGWETIVLQLAASRLGVVTAPLTSSSTPRRAANLILQTNASALVIGPTVAGRPEWKAFRSELSTETPTIKCLIAEPQGHVAKPGPPEVRFADLMTGVEQFDEFRTNPRETSVIVSTGGTTGPPKMAMQTDNAFVFSSRCFIDGFGLGDDLVYGCVGPYGHIVTAGWMLYLPFLVGGSVVPIPKWDPNEFVRSVAKHEITIANATSTHIFDVLQTEPGNEQLLSSLRGVFAAGKPDAFFEDFRARFGKQRNLVRSFGQTECLCHTMVDPSNQEAFGISDGLPFPGVEVRVIDPETGQPAEPGSHGEALIRTPALFRGYLGNRAATSAAMTDDGFYKSGDVVVRDESGIRVTSRMKDMIRRGGINIDPSEIETLALQHSSIRQCAVVGVEDERLGEKAAVVVSLRSGQSLRPEELSAFFLEAGLSKAYLPEFIEVFDELPVTEWKKSDKAKIRALLKDRGVNKTAQGLDSRLGPKNNRGGPNHQGDRS
jgi:acyl-CoA synthetase (AMP-forming)/AMP-acid ligase II